MTPVVHSLFEPFVVLLLEHLGAVRSTMNQESWISLCIC